MKFSPPKCPTCGAYAASITEMVLCIQPLLLPGEDEFGCVDSRDDEIEYDNNRGCKVHGDSQTPWDADGNGGVNLNCPNGHDWIATCDDKNHIKGCFAERPS